MSTILSLPQKFRLRLAAGAVGLLEFRFDGARSLSPESAVDAAFFARIPAGFLDKQWGFETLPDPGEAFAYGTINELGGGTVDDLRKPADIVRIRKACEIPPGAIS